MKFVLKCLIKYLRKECNRQIKYYKTNQNVVVEYFHSIRLFDKSVLYFFKKECYNIFAALTKGTRYAH